MKPLYALPRPEAFKADQWGGPDGPLHELGRVERYRLSGAALRAWRCRRAWHGQPHPETVRAVRERAGAVTMWALWSAMRHKAAVAAGAPNIESRIAMRARLARFISWQVRELLRYGNTIEGQQAGRELSQLLYLALVEPAALHSGEYRCSPREYCKWMNDMLGVAHPFDDGTALARHGARLEGFL